MKTFDRIIDVAGTTLFLAIVVINMVQIVLRSTTGGGLVYGEEAMRYFMIWSAMLALWLTVREDINIVAFEYDPSSFTGRIVRLLAYLIMIAIGLFILRYGYTVARANMLQTAPASGVVMALPYAAVPVGGALLAAASAQKIFAMFRKY